MLAGQDEGLICQDISKCMVRRRDTHEEQHGSQRIWISLLEGVRIILHPYSRILLSRCQEIP